MKRSKQRHSHEPVTVKERILFFDIIRILCIAIIVYDHSRFIVLSEINQFIFPDGFGPFNIYTNGLQGYAVYGLILVSGAVIEYNYQGIEKLTEYCHFLFKRFIRLYPAYWMSLILSLVVYFPVIISSTTVSNLIFEFTGFLVILGQGSGFINNMGWFIATIISLYILFPWFSKVMRKYGIWALLGFCILSWGLRYSIITYNLVPIDLFWRWFPLCNAFEFCLGIYLIQTGFYPKKPNKSPVIKEISDLSYYVFIFHTVVIFIFVDYFVPILIPFDLALANRHYIFTNALAYAQLMICVLATSWIAMKIDIIIRSWILNRDCIKSFLKKG